MTRLKRSPRFDESDCRCPDCKGVGRDLVPYGGKCDRCQGSGVIEIWRDIPSQPKYQASSEGRIRHKKYNRVRKLSIHPRLYHTVCLEYNKTQLVGRLVCEAFHGPAPKPTSQVVRLDGDRLNDRAENLKWGTHSEAQRRTKWILSHHYVVNEKQHAKKIKGPKLSDYS